MKAWHVTNVMTTDVVAAHLDMTYRELVDLLTGRHINAVPVIDDFRRILGVVSASDLLVKVEYAGEERPRWFQRRRRPQRGKLYGRTAAELMTSPAVVVDPGATTAAAARRMEEAGVKQLPVADDLGRLAGIVTRGDLLKQHLRPDEDIRGDVRAAVHDVIRWDNTATVDIDVDRGVVTLTGRVERWSIVALLARLVTVIPGVVEVVDRLAFDRDDHKEVGSTPAFFVA